MAALLEVQALTFAYQDRAVLKDVSLSITSGEVVGLIGPNGSGKSTLLRLVLGLHPGVQGEIRLGGTAITALSRRALAQRVALVPQDTAMEFAFRVRDIVAMGRYPHRGRLQPETPADGEAIQAAMTVTDTMSFATRPVAELSGGERQRVILARALAQQATLLLLDEPTAHLDIVHQLETLMLVRRLVQTGRGALIALHDLSLAARYCDRLIMLSTGQIVAQGSPATVLTPEHLARYFRVQAAVRTDAATGTPLVIPLAPLTSE